MIFFKKKAILKNHNYEFTNSFKLSKEINQIFGNIVLITRQNWFYETSKKPAQFKLNN